MSERDETSEDKNRALALILMRALWPHLQPNEIVPRGWCRVADAARRYADCQVEKERLALQLPDACQRAAGTEWMTQRFLKCAVDEDPAFIAAAVYRVMMAAVSDRLPHSEGDAP